jgi:hypothetical protein
MSDGLSRLGIGHAYAPGAAPDPVTQLAAAVVSGESPALTLAVAALAAIAAAALLLSLWGGPAARRRVPPRNRSSPAPRRAPRRAARARVRALLHERLGHERAPCGGT